MIFCFPATEFVIHCAAMRCYIFFGFLVLLFGASRLASFAAEPVDFSVAPAPKWIRSISPQLDIPPPPTAVDGGIDYPLLDEQVNLQEQTTYLHEVRRITSDSGVQEGASITISFDPAYQKLTLHSILLHRDSQVIDRLDRSKVKLLQRESDLESFLLDGRYTAQYQMEDIRGGDIIEFDYSLTGENPVIGGKYTDSFATNWTRPVHHFSLRFFYSSSRALVFKTFNKNLHSDTFTTANGLTEWVDDEWEIPAHHQDDNTPWGYDSFGRLEVSEFKDWSEVVNWALPLYQSNGPSTPEFDREIGVLNQIENKAARVSAALKFVQEKIRYLGLEDGVHSHWPTAPTEVLQRRFGDCKDKTLLLATLLRATGIDATPALVNTFRRETLQNVLPSPNAFNHVILRVKLGPETYWLDSTRTHQSGPLTQIYVGDYKRALLIAPNVFDLSRYSPPLDSLPQTKIVETYNVGHPADFSHLHITTTSMGAAADWTRTLFAETSLEKLKLYYLKFQARRYPGIKTDNAIAFEELPDGGCAVTEDYTIPKLWATDDHKSYKAAVVATDLNDRIGDIISPERDDPAALFSPNDVSETLHLNMFTPWVLTPNRGTIHSDFFRFEHQSTIQREKLTFNYRFKTIADRIPVSELVSYNEDLNKVKGIIGVSLTYNPDEFALSEHSTSQEKEEYFNLPIAALIGATFIIAMGLSLWLVIASRRKIPLPIMYEYSSWEGLGGWLILVAISNIIRPLAYLHAFFIDSKAMLNKIAWDRVTLPTSPHYYYLWKPALIFESSAGIIGLCLSSALLVIFFQKRAAYPRWAIVLLAYAFVTGLIDCLFIFNIPTLSSLHEKEARNVFTTLIAIAIWIPYLLLSKRVRATFRF